MARHDDYPLSPIDLDDTRAHCAGCEVVTETATLLHGFCRACSTCADCGRRAECVDGELCADCAAARDESAEYRANDGGEPCPPRPGISPSFYR